VYQIEMKAAVIEQRFPKSAGWRVTVDVDAMERGHGGVHPEDKKTRALAAMARLEMVGATIGAHREYGRADIVAEHDSHGVVVVEVEGSSTRQKEQAMYAALGQLLLQMKTGNPRVSYMLAVPDETPWRFQVSKIPERVRHELNLGILLVSVNRVEELQTSLAISRKPSLGDDGRFGDSMDRVGVDPDEPFERRDEVPIIEATAGLPQEGMADHVQLAAWSARFYPDAPPAIYHVERDEMIATIHGDSHSVVERALLIASAPALRDAVESAARMFRVMAEHGEGRERETGVDMLPLMESALNGLPHTFPSGH
jgi:hypothetical protein